MKAGPNQLHIEITYIGVGALSTINQQVYNFLNASTSYIAW